MLVNSHELSAAAAAAAAAAIFCRTASLHQEEQSIEKVSFFVSTF
jgi:hypothetical protein